MRSRVTIVGQYVWYDINMALIYITGPAGSGKSALQKELQLRGYEAYDEDAPEIGSAHNVITNVAVSIPPADIRDEDWFTNHEWRVRDTAMKKMHAKSVSQNVYFFGNSLKESEIRSFVDKIIYLDLDTATMRKRIANRTDNDYGKNDDEFSRILERQKDAAGFISNFEHQTIDAAESIEQVVAKIIRSTPTMDSQRARN